MKLSKKWANHLSTIIGISVAISTAWVTIDWSSFDITKEWPHLALTAIIAAGGFVSSIKIEE